MSTAACLSRAAAVFLCVASSALQLPPSPSAVRRRSAPLMCSADARFDRTLDDLLGSAPEELPALMGRELATLTDRGFFERLEARRLAAGDGAMAGALSELSDVALTFLETVANQVEALEPELAATQAAADVEISRVEAAARAAPADRRPVRQNASDGAAPERAGDADGSRERETRARHRFRVEGLLAAAQRGENSLDSLLHSMRDELDGGFFAHLRWEVEEQRAAGNERLLAILELVVRRACAEVEEGQLEVALLSALLQTSGSLARREMYERELVPASPEVRDSFEALVRRTKLEVEKAAMRGEEVDPGLLSQLRVIEVEMTRPIGETRNS